MGKGRGLEKTLGLITFLVLVLPETRWVKHFQALPHFPEYLTLGSLLHLLCVLSFRVDLTKILEFPSWHENFLPVASIEV